MYFYVNNYQLFCLFIYSSIYLYLRVSITFLQSCRHFSHQNQLIQRIMLYYMEICNIYVKWIKCTCLVSKNGNTKLKITYMRLFIMTAVFKRFIKRIKTCIFIFNDFPFFYLVGLNEIKYVIYLNVINHPRTQPDIAFQKENNYFRRPETLSGNSAIRNSLWTL